MNTVTELANLVTHDPTSHNRRNAASALPLFLSIVRRLGNEWAPAAGHLNPFAAARKRWPLANVPRCQNRKSRRGGTPEGIRPRRLTRQRAPRHGRAALHLRHPTTSNQLCGGATFDSHSPSATLVLYGEEREKASELLSACHLWRSSQRIPGIHCGGSRYRMPLVAVASACGNSLRYSSQPWSVWANVYTPDWSPYRA